MVHIDAEMAFTNTRHEDFIGKPGEQPHSHDSPEYTQSLNSVKRKIDQTAKVLVAAYLSAQHRFSAVYMYVRTWFAGIDCHAIHMNQ